MQVPACRRLFRCRERITRRVADRNARIEASLVCHKREEQVRDALVDRKAFERRRSVGEPRDRQRSSWPDSRSCSLRRTERSYPQRQCRVLACCSAVFAAYATPTRKYKVSIVAGLAARDFPHGDAGSTGQRNFRSRSSRRSAAQRSSLSDRGSGHPTPSSTTRRWHRVDQREPERTGRPCRLRNRRRPRCWC